MDGNKKQFRVLKLDVENLIEEMYEDKILNLLESYSELSYKSEDYVHLYKKEIIQHLLPKIYAYADFSEISNDEELYTEIYNSDNIWLYSIYRILESYNIKDNLLEDRFVLRGCFPKPKWEL